MNDKIVELYKELFSKKLKNAKKQEYKDKSFADLIESRICVPATYQKGGEYKHGGIMVVGQAKNGWEITDYSDLDDLLKKMNERANNPKTQFYLADYRGVERDVDSKKNKKRDKWSVATSKYEKLVYCVVSNSNNFDKFLIRGKDEEMEQLLLHSWPQSMVESELLKISPKEGGNPTGTLLTSQMELCIEILKEEIELFEPSRILFGTGKNNLEILVNSFKLNYIKENKYILASGDYRNTKGEICKIVICSRPEAFENNFSDSEIIEQAKCIRKEFGE